MEINSSNIDSDSTLSLQEIIEDIIYDEDIEDHFKCRKTAINRVEIPKTNFWEAVYPFLPPTAFVKKYRVCRSTFEELCDEYFEQSGYVDYEVWRKVLALTIDYLSSSARQFDLSILYGMSIGYVNLAIDNCVDILATCVKEDVVTWPNEDEREIIAARNFKRWNIPGCIGAVDGTLIRIKGYQPNKADLNTRKSHYGFNLVLISDDCGLIRYCITGSCGSLSDSDVLDDSDLFRSIEDKFLNSQKQSHNYYIISDKGIKNTDYIVTPFIDDGKLS